MTHNVAEFFVLSMDNIKYDAPDKNYLKVCSEMLYDSRLSDKDIRLFQIMATMPDGITFTINGFPMLKRIQQLNGFKRDSVKRSIANLIRCGYVVFTRSRYKDGKVFGGTYMLYGTPINHKCKNAHLDEILHKQSVQNSTNGSNDATTDICDTNTVCEPSEPHVQMTTCANNNMLSKAPEVIDIEHSNKDIDRDKELEDCKYMSERENFSRPALPKGAFYVGNIVLGADPDLPF